MRYLIRLNPRAFNAITRKIIPERLWEIEQCATKDSEKCVWHCADIRIDAAPIRTLYTLPRQEEKPWEAEYFGICVRGQDNVVEILTGDHDASGN